jgi:hypothetical protein
MQGRDIRNIYQMRLIFELVKPMRNIGTYESPLPPWEGTLVLKYKALSLLTMAENENTMVKKLFLNFSRGEMCNT